MVRSTGVRAPSGGASANTAQGRTVTSLPGDQHSLGDLVAIAAKDVSQLVRYDIDLAKTELRADVKRAAMTGALFGFAAFVGCLVLVLLSFALALGLHAAGAGALYICFIYAAIILVLLAGLLAGVALLVIRRFSGMKQTRKTVTDDVEMLRQRGANGTKATPRRAHLNGSSKAALPSDGAAKVTAEISDDRSS
jgi:hypothetical protein